MQIFKNNNVASVMLGDCLQSIATLPDKSINCCVTSPPYYGLRDYGHAGQIGLEESPEIYIAKLVDVFREVRRTLTDDGTLWVNIGDSYASFRDGKATPDTTRGDDTGTLVPKGSARNRSTSTFKGSGIKHKDLVGIPLMLAFALRADGWYLRQDIIWNKPNTMPESVRDRCTKSHEYVFLLSKSEKYHFDNAAIMEPAVGGNKGASASFKRSGSKRGVADVCPASPTPTHRENRPDVKYDGDTRNRRSVWNVATRPYKGAHFAVFPQELIEPCILAGCPCDGVVLDPFGGSGTTAGVALTLGRNAVICELNPEYLPLMLDRIESIK